MRTLIKIIRDRDQSVLEQDVAEAADGTAVGRMVGDLLGRIRDAHPQADLRYLTIKIASGSTPLAGSA